MPSAAQLGRIRTSGKLKARYLKDGVFKDKLETTKKWAVELPFDAPECRKGHVTVQWYRHLSWLQKLPGLRRLVRDRLWMVIHKGFIWDGASGPTIDPSRWLEPPCMHDAGYGLIMSRDWPEHLRDEVDSLFYRMLDERKPPRWKRPTRWYGWLAAPFTGAWWMARRGVHEVRARVWYRAVDTFGAPFARPRDRHPVSR